MTTQSTPVPYVATESLVSPAFIRVLAAQVAMGLGFSSYFLLPKYLTQQLGASASAVGGYGSAGLLSAVLVSPLVGSVLDRFGRRTPMLLGGVIIALTSVGMATVDQLGAWLLLLRLVQGVGYALTFNAASAITADLAPSHRLAQAMGLLGASSLLSNAIAPPLAESVAAHWGWQWVFLFAAGTGVLVCCLGWPLLDSRVSPAPTRISSAPRITPDLIKIWFMAAVNGATFGTLITYTQPFALELGAARLSNYLIGYTIGALTIRLGFARTADRLGRERVARSSLALYGVVCAITAYLDPGWLLAFGLGFGLAHGFIYPALAALAAEASPAERRGRALSIFNGAFNLGSALAIFGCGWVAHAFDYPTVFLLVGMIAFATAVTIQLKPPPPISTPRT